MIEPPCQRTGQSGFSLLEVLVAFSILALSLGILLQIFSTGVRSAVISGHYSKALIIAESQIALVGLEDPLEPGELSGEEGDIYHWRVSVEEYEEEDAPSEVLRRFKPYLVTVAVGWDETEKSFPVRLTTLRLGAEP